MKINLILKINIGESFGELALIDKKPRSASITCIGDCHFITLDKTSFDKILSKFIQIKMCFYLFKTIRKLIDKNV